MNAPAFEDWLRLLINAGNHSAAASPSDFGVPEIFRSLAANLQRDNDSFLRLQNRYYKAHLKLWTTVLRGDRERQRVEDRRFTASEWSDFEYFDFLRRSYLLNSEWLMELVELAALDDARKRKLKFFARQLVDAFSPANFPALNPEAIKLAAQTNGESARRGIRHALSDFAKGRISMSDESAFAVGSNLAVTRGGVIYRNELIELIQYSPATIFVSVNPLLIVPPCINKFYILDLRPENSFVRYCVERGIQVFLISWRNIPRAMGQTTWDDYLGAIIKAMQVTREISRAKKLNVLGFCVGGTLLACALAALAQGERRGIASMTLLASMLDFSDVGEIAAYVDDAYVEKLERDFAQGGVLPGRDLALAFASLRANELIWSYVVNNYLKGKTPSPFDFLYWNSDSANLPGPMYAYYVRNMYLENNLKVANRLTMLGRSIDLGELSMPSYVLGTIDDHIVPWKTAYASARLLRGDVKFVLGASGHVAGVINPPAKKRKNFWRNPEMAETADKWYARAESLPGSWWTDWSDWLKPHLGKPKKPNTTLGSKVHRFIEDAPGSYVVERVN